MINNESTITMNLSMKWLSAMAFSVAIATAIVFAVLPMLPDAPGGVGLSLQAQDASACCGDGGAGGPGGNNDQQDPEPEPGVCEINPDEQTIELGESATFSWGTSNVSQVTLNGDEVDEDGEETVTPNAAGTYTYTIRAYQSGKVGGLSLQDTCVTQVIVEEPEEIDPICTLIADDTTIELGESTNLNWTTDNAVSVSINQGIGSVNFDDSTSVSPTQDTTYTLTATDADGDTIQCQETITVEESETDDPLCVAFTGSPTSLPVGGGNVELTWDTENGDSVSIDQGVGSVGPDGNTIVSVANDITYTLTVDGNNTQDQCTVPIEVAEPGDPAVCESFTATPNSFNNGTGGTVTLEWDTTNASDVSINQGIGSVDLDGSATTSVTEDTTFTLTASSTDGTDQCTATVTVDEPSSSDLECELSVSDGTVNSGDTFQLIWETTGATDVEINRGIGSVDLDGSRNTSITSDTTFTLTASDGDDEVQCTVDVNVRTGGGGGGGSSSPRCDFEANKERISRGEEVILTWDNSRTNDILIEDDRGDVLVDTEDSNRYDEDEDSITVTPDRDTTYTLTAFRGIRDDECEVEITIEDDVTVLSERSQPPLVAGISLSQVPYTGFEAGPALTALFYAILALWGLAVTYILVVKKSSIFGLSLTSAGAAAGTRMHQDARTTHTNPEPVARVATPTAAAPVNLPTGTFDTDAYSDEPETAPSEVRNDTPVATAQVRDETSDIEERAHDSRVLLSSDAIRYIVDAGQDQAERLEVLDGIIERAKASYPSEEGWVVVNKERINELFARETTTPVESHGALPSDAPVGASSLAEAIVTGNVQAAYMLLGERPMFALADAATDLDALYRYRRGEHVVISDMLREAARDLSDEQITAAMTGLLTSVNNGTYTDQDAIAKLAIMKAVRALA